MSSLACNEYDDVLLYLVKFKYFRMILSLSHGLFARTYPCSTTANPSWL